MDSHDEFGATLDNSPRGWQCTDYEEGLLELFNTFNAEEGNLHHACEAPSGGCSWPTSVPVPSPPGIVIEPSGNLTSADDLTEAMRRVVRTREKNRIAQAKHRQKVKVGTKHKNSL
jgi:hypothetical protein